MEVHFKPELEEKLAQSAARQGRNPEELVEEVVSQYFDEESRLIEAVSGGEEAFERGEYLTHEEAGQRLQRFLRPDGGPLVPARRRRHRHPANDSNATLALMAQAKRSNHPLSESL